MEDKEIKDLGFELAHIGINQENAAEAEKTAELLCALFGFSARETDGSVFVNEQFEIMKHPFLGKMGHVAIRTSDPDRARAYLEGKGVAFREDTAGYGPDGRLNAIYFRDDIGGFAFHLLRKK
jgi:2-dehydro-3-deoxyphosphogluconate aldolase/(4S)-4-hydroxy-2-oxoglutarate aldolase